MRPFLSEININNLNNMSEIIGLPIVLFDKEKELIYSTHPQNEKVEEYQHAVFPVLESVCKARYPQIYLGRYGHVRSAIPYPAEGEIEYYVLLDVVLFRKLSHSELENALSLIEGHEEGKKRLLRANEEMKVYSYVEYVKMVKMIYYMMYNKVVEESRLLYKSDEYIWEQTKIFVDGNNFFKEENEQIPYIRIEEQLLQSVRSGNLEQLKTQLKSNLSSFANDREFSNLRAAKNYVIRSIALVAQAAKEGGVGKSIADSLAEIYYGQVEKCTLVETVEVLYIQMYLEFGTRVSNCYKVEGQSKRVKECCKYISDHIYEPLTVGCIAEELSVSAEHLSRQFRQETGETIASYIKKYKMKLAEGLLAYSDHSITEISAKLGYSSQSHFSTIFKQEKGVTPQEFRKQKS